MLSSIFGSLLFFHCVSADNAFFDPLIFFGRPKLGTLYEPYSPTETTSDDGGFDWKGLFPQKLDHFSDDTKQWSQYYFQRSLSNSAHSEVAFLILGGNGAINEGWFLDDDSPYVQWAQKNNAVLFGLEHRFYGRNRGALNASTENLKYLTISQASKDVETFINWLKMTNLAKNVKKWILFGGSYAGSIALWLRQTNPNLIFGAVASSAPLEGKLDAYEYNMIVENFFDKNPDCKKAIKQRFDLMLTEFYKKDTREKLDTSLKLKLGYTTPNTTTGYTDTQFLYWTLQQPFQLITQYYKTGKRFNGYGLDELCISMSLKDDKLDDKGDNALLGDLYTVIETMYKTYYGTTIDKLDNDYKNAVASLQSFENDTTGDNNQNRLWLWQLCTELGYSLTTDYIAPSLFDSTVSPSLFINMCKDVFDLNLSDILNGIKNTKKTFGGIAGYTGTNVIITSATYDTYQYFTKKHATDKSVKILSIQDAGHGSDVFPSDDAAIKGIQRNINTAIEKMLQAEFPPPTEASTELPWNAEFRVCRTPPKFYSITNDNYRSMSLPRSNLVQQQPRSLPQVFFGRPPFGFNPSPKWSENNGILLNFRCGHLGQAIDHEDENTKYFKQAFCRTGDFATNNGPIYLLLGGESAMDSNWIKDNSSTIVQMARENGAIIYHLEHRFFGESTISDQYGFNRLKYLTLTQAINDVASFVTAMNDVTSTESKQWIVFGSSYAGTIAALARASYPDLIAGAVVSSAMLDPQFSYLENSNQVQKIIEASNKNCAEKIKEVFLQLRTDIFDQSKELDDLFPSFSNFKLSNQQDQEFFFLNLYNAIQGAFFFNQIESLADSYPQMKDVCAITDVKTLSTFYEETMELYNNGQPGKKTLTRDETIALIQGIYDEPNGKQDDIATVNWIWLSCYELASFPTTDSGDSIFGSPTSVDFFLGFCKDAFGALLETNYGSLQMENQIRAENFIINIIEKTLGNTAITSGDMDPRFSLTIPQVTTDKIDFRIINGTSHAVFLYPPSANDPAELTKARKEISQELGTWHASPTTPVTMTPGSSTKPPPNTGTPNVEATTRSARSNGILFFVCVLFVLIM